MIDFHAAMLISKQKRVATLISDKIHAKKIILPKKRRLFKCDTGVNSFK